MLEVTGEESIAVEFGCMFKATLKRGYYVMSRILCSRFQGQLELLLLRAPHNGIFNLIFRFISFLLKSNHGKYMNYIAKFTLHRRLGFDLYKKSLVFQIKI